MNDSSQRVDPARERQPRDRPPAGANDSLWEGLVREGNALLSAVGRYLSVQGDLARAHAQRLALAVAAGLLGLLVAVGVLIVAGFYILEGLAGGLALLFNATWAGQLVAGLIVFGGAVGGFLFWRHAAEQRRVEELSAKYQRQPSEP